MGKKGINITLLLICVIILTVVIATTKKVYDLHTEKLLRVVSQKISEAGESCNRQEVCGDEFTLNYLVEKKYINLVVHPITKEYVDGNLIIKCENFDCTTKVE